jgi:hypothetical protein
MGVKIIIVIIVVDDSGDFFVMPMGNDIGNETAATISLPAP